MVGVQAGHEDILRRKAVQSKGIGTMITWDRGTYRNPAELVGGIVREQPS
jgi:hypothetical protein